MTRYHFPRARGDAESAARARAVAWRGIAVFVVIYAAIAVVMLFKVIIPVFWPAIEAAR